MELTDRVTQVEDAGEDAVMALWGMENEARVLR